MNKEKLARTASPIRNNERQGLLYRFIIWLLGRGDKGPERLRRLGDEATMFSIKGAVLYLLDKDARTVQIPITKSEFILGRKWEKVDYCFVGEGMGGVSRVHAAIISDGSGYYITDKNSSGGTFINGSRLEGGQSAPLRNGDVISLYNVRLLFEVG